MGEAQQTDIKFSCHQDTIWVLVGMMPFLLVAYITARLDPRFLEHHAFVRHHPGASLVVLLAVSITGSQLALGLWRRRREARQVDAPTA